MKIYIYKMTRTIIACALTVLIAAPAIADDTELLLVNPDPSQRPRSNVMFILDTSGSMRTDVVGTATPYDSNRNYLGDCNTNAIYWTDVDVTPVCNVANPNTQFVDKESFHCDFATRQINGIGSFTNTMVQYRSDADSPANWQYLEPDNSSDPVECQSDSGMHGEDATSDAVYAASGAGLADPWTSDANAEVSWGSAPRNLAYTVFDGNYLNWKANPEPTTLSRNEIMISVVNQVLSSVDNLNVGLMRFNGRDGGVVIHAIEDLATGRSSLTTAVGGLPANGNTPLSEILHESALYWRGLPAFFAKKDGAIATDPAALVFPGTAEEVYKRPVTEACTKNFNVLLSDGEPNRDNEAEIEVPKLPEFSATLGGRTACSGAPSDGSCMDDVTEYLSIADIDPVATGIQTVTTHTIGFTTNLQILRDTAEISGGQYFLADDVETLALALLQIIANINDRSLSFSAPAVSVNTFNRTQNLNDLYLTMFGARSRAHWPGNLKKYSITNRIITDANDDPAVDPATGFFFDTARSIWTSTATAADGNDVQLGGAANLLPDPTARKLYTNNTGGNDLTNATNLITPSNAASFSDSDFGLSGATGEPTMDEVIRWMLGEDVQDEDNNTATTVRNAMGDPLHSQPAAIIYGGSAASPDVVVYTATNDGYLHAIDGNNGTELWSFVPMDLLSNMTRLFFDPAAKFKQYGIDGNVVPIVKDENRNGIIDGADFVYLIFGMRRGGTSYYALDVTDKNSPQLLWKKSLTNAGQSWSSPVVAKMDISGVSQDADKAVVVIGGGYDPVHDTRAHPTSEDSVGAGIHFLDLKSGTTLWRTGPDSGANLRLKEMTRAIPNEVRVVDVSGDGLADRMYASDLGGQVWRFDIINGKAPTGTGNDALVRGGIIAQLGAEGLSGTPSDADTRRFYNAPDVSVFNDVIQDKRFIAISIGSGYRVHPFDLSAADQFFSIRDKNIFNALTQAEYDNFTIVKESDLVDVSGKTKAVITNAKSGWRFSLPANQKVLADSVTFDGSIFFVAFSPDSVAAASCSAGRGTNFLYRVSVVNGDPVVNNLDTLADADADDARNKTLAQGGIAPTPAILFPSPDDPAACVGNQCSPPPLMCVGVECSEPGFGNDPVRTLWTQDGIQ